MKNLSRLINLFGRYKKWVILGIVFSLVSSLAGIALLAVSGWFIASMGLAGVAGLAINYFTPAAIIRACSILRTGGRYLERLVTHEATFQIIAHLRVWFYKSFEALTSFDLGKSRSGDLMARLRGDIDKLERFYLGFLVPASVSLLAIIVIGVIFAFYDYKLSLTILAYLLLSGWLIPFLVYKKSKIIEKSQIDIEAKIKAFSSESLQGMSELLIYDQLNTHQNKLSALGQDYQINQNKLGIINSLAQNLIIFLTGLALLNMIILLVPMTQANLLNLADLAMLALLTIASFEVVSLMPQAFQGLGAVEQATKRIFEIVDKKPAIIDPLKPVKIAKNFNPNPSVESELILLDRDIDNLDEKILVHSNMHESFSSGLDLSRDGGGNLFSNDGFGFNLKFENVSFAYDKNKEYILNSNPSLENKLPLSSRNIPNFDENGGFGLNNVSFALKAGEKMAIVGPTGAGKSTIVNLILRFCEPDKGKIILGDKEINSFKLEDLRDQFAVLPQKPYIFANTIYENLIFANPEASQKDIDEACKMAGIHDFIMSLPKGYETYIGENGSTLSGGQIKRLGLARALLKKAPCLILDEMGEGLDYQMELDILKRVIKNLGNKSLIIITHRMAGLEFMDDVLHLR